MWSITPGELYAVVQSGPFVSSSRGLLPPHLVHFNRIDQNLADALRGEELELGTSGGSQMWCMSPIVAVVLRLIVWKL
jgi:hypothetical protein